MTRQIVLEEEQFSYLYPRQKTYLRVFLARANDQLESRGTFEVSVEEIAHHTKVTVQTVRTTFNRISKAFAARGYAPPFLLTATHLVPVEAGDITAETAACSTPAMRLSATPRMDGFELTIELFVRDSDTLRVVRDHALERLSGFGSKPRPKGIPKPRSECTHPGCQSPIRATKRARFCRRHTPISCTQCKRVFRFSDYPHLKYGLGSWALTGGLRIRLLRPKEVGRNYTTDTVGHCPECTYSPADRQRMGFLPPAGP